MIQIYQRGNSRYLFLVLGIILSMPLMNSQQCHKSGCISKKLESILFLDQNVRTEYDSVYFNNQPSSLVVKEAVRKLNETDSINQHEIDFIFREHGWLMPPEVSIQASRAYYFVIQHAPFEYQKKYKSDICRAFDHNIISEQEYAFFIDRYLLHEGKYQLYGTQINVDPLGHKYYIPIDTLKDRSSVRSDSFDDGFLVLDGEKSTTIFIHVFNKEFKKGFEHVRVTMNDLLMGYTNENGYLQIVVPKIHSNNVIKIEKGTSIAEYSISDLDRNYFDLFFTLKNEIQ